MAECENEAMVEAPLANTDEWNDFNGFQNLDADNSNTISSHTMRKVCEPKEAAVDGQAGFLPKDNVSNQISSISLEDLVNNFDETIDKCFSNFNETTAKIAPVQAQTPEELLDNCSMWWTITGNYGNMLPLDWHRTHARELQLQALNLGEPRELASKDSLDLSSDDELRSALDLHRTVSGQIRGSCEDVIDADSVINEITDMMEEPCDMADSGVALSSSLDVACAPCVIRSDSSHLHRQQELKALGTGELNDLLLTLEPEVVALNEQLVTQLAERDELEHRRELQNQFISLLLQLQRDRKALLASPSSKRDTGVAKGTYMTTVIPYHAAKGPADNHKLQIYIKLLKAMVEDSPTVPSLLTDYILKVLCPT